MTSSYRGAAAHYLSPGRRDPVKRQWEEPVNHRIVASAIDRLRAAERPLRVVDIGAGTGDGVALLERSLPLTAQPGRPFHYLGIDPDPEMIETARALHHGRPDVEFVRADVREPLPVDEVHGVDLYLSTGVPYSHLSHGEFDDALTALFTATAGGPHPTAIVLDVLGRYSIEWTPRWGSEQWDYEMSFFQDVDASISAPMSFHSRSSLEGAIRGAQQRTGIRIAPVEYHDRSVVVGRHTTTAAFHPGLPNYRGMVNRCYDGDTLLDLGALELRPVNGPDGTPAEVTAFFAALTGRWNDRLERARTHEARVGPSAAGRVRLAADLCALEHDAEQGLGAGHTLIGLVVANPDREPDERGRRATISR